MEICLVVADFADIGRTVQGRPLIVTEEIHGIRHGGGHP